jgi:haloacetate dehalogenase
VFAGFRLDRIDGGEAELRVRHGGSGPPVVLIHGPAEAPEALADEVPAFLRAARA